MIELIPGKRYYGRWGMGWMVLVNGQPEKEALDLVHESGIEILN